MECMGQDLGKLVKSKTPLEDKNVMFFMYQMLCGLYALHSANVIHRDLKPNNLLINEEFDLKICDFGLARALDLEKEDKEEKDAHMSTYYVVTRWYRAPELCMSYEKSYKPLDIWSMGCIMGELLQKPQRRPLFPGSDTLKQLNLILDAIGKQEKQDIKGVPNAINYVLKRPIKEKVSLKNHSLLSHVENKEGKYFYFTLAIDLLEKLLSFNPEKRISVEDALKHSYFKEIYDEADLIKFPKLPYANYTETNSDYWRSKFKLL